VIWRCQRVLGPEAPRGLGHAFGAPITKTRNAPEAARKSRRSGRPDPSPDDDRVAIATRALDRVELIGRPQLSQKSSAERFSGSGTRRTPKDRPPDQPPRRPRSPAQIP
jgi:hypothetical protein